MDFSEMTVEALLDRLVETGECRTWEFKSVASLKDNFHSKLARQVSAFANSLGGHIVIGVKEVVKGVKYEPEVVPSVQGKTPTQDWLARMVSTSVSYPLQEFKIHRIPFENNAEEAIFVIEVGDSPTAPHQTNVNDEKVYYWRYQSRTEHAPHIHLELLRNRVTKAIIEVVAVRHSLLEPEEKDDHVLVHFQLYVFVRNISGHSTTDWGVHIKTELPDAPWSTKTGGFSRGGACHHAEQRVLLPDERSKVVIPVTLYLDRKKGGVAKQFLSYWRQFNVEVRAASQNHVGPPASYGWESDEEWDRQRNSNSLKVWLWKLEDIDRDSS